VKRIVLNEDSSHFFCWHPEEEMNLDGLDTWLDQYADTQVGELVFCVNAQRSSVASEVKQPVWDGFDPEAGTDQPFLSGIRDQPFIMPHGAREHFRRWARGAWLLHSQGIDPYDRWIERSRTHGIVPFLSIRMNDVHFVDQPEHPIHDRFWKEHPEFRRAPEDRYNGQCLDYERPEVQAYMMSFIREIVGRYDLDGLELDWMRNPFHLRPGREAAGRTILTEFTSDVRALLDERAKELGHLIQLRARVPWRPQTALGLGMDAEAWAMEGLIDKLDVAPFLYEQFDLPVEDWRRLLAETSVTLSAGLLQGVRPYKQGGPRGATNLETARGAATAMLDRGADQIYLFNFMDYHPFGNWGDSFRNSEPGRAYARILREVGGLETMADKSRRHVLVVPDTWAPDEVPDDPLPCDLGIGETCEFRIHIGPAPGPGQCAQVRVSVRNAGEVDFNSITVRVNGTDCRSSGRAAPPPEWEVPDSAFEIPAGTLRRGYNDIEIANKGLDSLRLIWLELSFSNQDGQWPSTGVDVVSLHPKLWAKRG